VADPKRKCDVLHSLSPHRSPINRSLLAYYPPIIAPFRIAPGTVCHVCVQRADAGAPVQSVPVAANKAIFSPLCAVSLVDSGALG
jgi:hypothetical protein